jgi:hypothetical protein
MTILDETFNEKYWNFWRNYKTQAWARKKAINNQGVWIAMQMNEKLLTPQERRDLGNWIVGRSDEFLLYYGKHEDFHLNYPVFDVYRDGQCLVSWERGHNLTLEHPDLLKWKESLQNLVLQCKGDSKEAKSEIEKLSNEIFMSCLFHQKLI